MARALTWLRNTSHALAVPGSEFPTVSPVHIHSGVRTNPRGANTTAASLLTVIDQHENRLAVHGQLLRATSRTLEIAPDCRSGRDNSNKI